MLQKFLALTKIFFPSDPRASKSRIFGVHTSRTARTARTNIFGGHHGLGLNGIGGLGIKRGLVRKFRKGAQESAVPNIGASTREFHEVRPLTLRCSDSAPFPG